MPLENCSKWGKWGKMETAVRICRFFVEKLGQRCAKTPQKHFSLALGGCGGVYWATCPRKNGENGGKWGGNGGKWGEMGDNRDEDKRDVSQCLPLHLLPASFCLCALWPTKCTCLRGCAMSPSRTSGILTASCCPRAGLQVFWYLDGQENIFSTFLHQLSPISPISPHFPPFPPIFPFGAGS